MMERAFGMLCSGFFIVMGLFAAWRTWEWSRENFALAASTHIEALNAGKWSPLFDIYVRTFETYGQTFAMYAATSLLVAGFGIWLLVDIIREPRQRGLR